MEMDVEQQKPNRKPKQSREPKQVPGAQQKSKGKAFDKQRQWEESVADRLIEQIREGTAPWQKPWNPKMGDDTARNAATGKAYKGINQLWLMSQGRNDPRWLTYKQAKDMGAQVRKGEKGVQVSYWKRFENKVKVKGVDKEGKNKESDPDQEEEENTRTRVRWQPFTSTVFNAEQIDGLPPYEPPEVETPTWEGHARADSIIANSGAEIRHKVGDRAFYSPTTDIIVLPERHQFDDADNYYSTALHELGHWTGHESRLDRPLMNCFGTTDYAQEELRAEIASMMLSREIGVGFNPHQSASYAASWSKKLSADGSEIHKATRDARKIKEYLLDFENVTEKEEAV
jgi:antirestriction protein ArdC